MEQNLKIMDYDCMMKRNIKVTRMITEALKSLQEMFNELKRQKPQLPIMMFFHKVEKKKCPLSKTLSQQYHLSLTSSTHHCSRLLTLLQLPKMILMTVLPFHQKIKSQSGRCNAYTITPIHLLIVVIVLSSYRRHHRHYHHHHQ